MPWGKSSYAFGCVGDLGSALRSGRGNRDRMVVLNLVLLESGDKISARP